MADSILASEAPLRQPTHPGTRPGCPVGSPPGASNCMAAAGSETSGTTCWACCANGDWPLGALISCCMLGASDGAGLERAGARSLLRGGGGTMASALSNSSRQTGDRVARGGCALRWGAHSETIMVGVVIASNRGSPGWGLEPTRALGATQEWVLEGAAPVGICLGGGRGE